MAPDLSFGPEGDQWHYDRATKTYDLTRGSETRFTIHTAQGALSGASLSISPALSALVVVDMQNFFLHTACREHPTGLAAVPPILRMVGKCRELGVQV
jgi:phosphatidylethanolamine-binding protein